ncbi:MAG: hypothetical protein AB1700_19450, partial [Bacillota bacterium]
LAEVKRLASQRNVAFSPIGEVGGARLVIDADPAEDTPPKPGPRRIVDIGVSDLSRVYRGAIGWALES